MEKSDIDIRLEELNTKCMNCIAKANESYEVVDRRRCLACEIGMEIHRLEVKRGDKWDKVDWNSARFEEYYHN